MGLVIMAEGRTEMYTGLEDVISAFRLLMYICICARCAGSAYLWSQRVASAMNCKGIAFDETG